MFFFTTMWSYLTFCVFDANFLSLPTMLSLWNVEVSFMYVGDEGAVLQSLILSELILLWSDPAHHAGDFTELQPKGNQCRSLTLDSFSYSVWHHMTGADTMRPTLPPCHRCVSCIWEKNQIWGRKNIHFNMQEGGGGKKNVFDSRHKMHVVTIPVRLQWNIEMSLHGTLRLETIYFSRWQVLYP